MRTVALFISDSHLGQGGSTDDFPPQNENSFAEFLGQQSERYQADDLQLVLLGDFLDIWSVATDAERTAADTASIDIALAAGDQVSRTQRIIDAHPLAFESLTAFLRSAADRRRVSCVVGNHDHSLGCHQVQYLVREAIAKGDPNIRSRIEFPIVYDNPGLRVYAEHGNQYDANNHYEQFPSFGNECPGYYFVRLVWNRLRAMAPYLDDWAGVFRALWTKKLGSLVVPAFRFFKQYRQDPRDFKLIDVPYVPFFAETGGASKPTTGEPLAGFPEILLSPYDDPGRVFSADPETENQLRALYHDSQDHAFRDWVDEVLREKSGSQPPAIPAERALGAVEFGLFADPQVRAVAGMFSDDGQASAVVPLRGKALDPAGYDYVLFGHTHEEKSAAISTHRATYYNTGTWKARYDTAGRNASRLCFVEVSRDESGAVAAAQRYWPLSERRTLPAVSQAPLFAAAAPAASAINHDLLAFFTAHHKPGAIGLIGADDLVGTAIREAQRSLTKGGAPSLWSHVFILGELRGDRRGPQGAVTNTPYLFESDLHVLAGQPQLRNGVQENWIGKWCRGNIQHAAVIDLGLSPQETALVLATALQLTDEEERARYPLKELVGTWLAIVTGRRWLRNPFDDPRAMYCSAYVRHCYREARRDFLDTSVSTSNTTPEDVARAGAAANALTIFHR